MKLNSFTLVATAACSLFFLADSTFAQGTAFTYQGRLESSGAPANGNFDFVVELYNALSNGAPQGMAVTNLDVGVTNGLFVVTNDFGAGPWSGQPLWLQLLVRTNNGGTFTSLSPRQAATSTPYAIQSLNASNAVSATTSASANSVAAANITGVGTLPAAVLPSSVITNTEQGVTLQGAFSGNGNGLTNLSATQVANGTLADARLSTNAALLNKNQIFSGINLFDNNVSITPGVGADALSIAGSITGNFASPLALVQNNSTAVNASPALRVVGNGGTPNGVLSVSTQGNLSGSLIAQFGNANAFVAQLDFNGNWIASSYSGVGSGLTSLNASQLASGVVAPGVLPGFQSSSNYSTVGGGQQNTIALASDHSAIGGGWMNSIGNDDYEGTIAGGYINHLLANSAYASIAGGEGNTGAGYWSAIGGGNDNTNYGDAGTIAGGQLNAVSNSYQPTVGGGYGNTAGSNYATVAGGINNLASAPNSAVGGGQGNATLGISSVISGGHNNKIDSTNTASFIGGGSGNYIGQIDVGSVIAGGVNNNIQQYGSFYGTGSASFIGGGSNNAIAGSDSQSAIVGGANNSISFQTTGSFIGGGYGNYIEPLAGTSVILGGTSNVIGSTAENSLAAGFMAVANYPGSFVWSDDSSASQFGDAEANSFNVRATGGAFFDTSGRGIFVDGQQLATQAFVLQYVGQLSDRNAKENFTPVDSGAVLDKVLALPMTSWNYKASENARHLGPMAQDFHAAFGLNGGDDTHIAVVDEGGVALAAIQGLNRKLEATEQAVQEKDAKINDLEKRLRDLEQVVQSLAARK